jgi:hypothetical protein
MKNEYQLPRHALVVFFWCALLTALLCIASIAAFLWLMPENEHGRRGIVTAYQAFLPGIVIAGLIAVISFRLLRKTSRGTNHS